MSPPRAIGHGGIRLLFLSRALVPTIPHSWERRSPKSFWLPVGKAMWFGKWSKERSRGCGLSKAPSSVAAAEGASPMSWFRRAGGRTSPGSSTIPLLDSSSPRPTVWSCVDGSSRNRETLSSVWQKYFLLGETVSMGHGAAGRGQGDCHRSDWTCARVVSDRGNRDRPRRVARG